MSSDGRGGAWQAPGRLTTVLLFSLLCVVWGSTWLVIKVGLRDVPPFTGAAVRFLLAGAGMALVVQVWGAREGGGRPPLVAVLAHGFFQFSLNYGLVYLSETVIPSGMVAVLWAVFPLLIAMGEHFVLRTSSLSPSRWAGIALAFTGVAALFATDLAAVDARAVTYGLLLLLAPLGVTVSTLIIKRTASRSSSLILNRDAMLFGAVTLGIVAFLVEEPARVTWTASAVSSVLYLALAGTVLTFGVYLWLLRFVPAYRMSLVSFVTPVIALLVGATLGEEPLGLFTLLGTGLVLGGMGLVLRKA